MLCHSWGPVLHSADFSLSVEQKRYQNALSSPPGTERCSKWQRSTSQEQGRPPLNNGGGTRPTMGPTFRGNPESTGAHVDDTHRRLLPPG